MKQIYICLLFVSAVATAQTLTSTESSQATASKVSEPTIMGLKPRDFVNAQAAITDTSADTKIADLNAQIEKLINQRDELMIALALKNHPEQTDAITIVANAGRAAKAKAKSQ